MAVLWQEPDTMEHEELTIHGRRLLGSRCHGNESFGRRSPI